MFRKQRTKNIPKYTDIKSIYDEVEYGEKVMRRLQEVQVIDVTNQSVEEIASRIVD